MSNGDDYNTKKLGFYTRLRAQIRKNARMTEERRENEKKKKTTKIIYFELNGFMFKISHALAKWKTFTMLGRKKN